MILSDRGVDENHVPIPSLAGCFCTTAAPCKDQEEYFSCYYPGDPASQERFIILQLCLGYGACASQPISGIMETIHELIDTHMLNKDYYAAVEDYDHGSAISGIVKIASKMGISTIQSYQGSQIFEAIGISQRK